MWGIAPIALLDLLTRPDAVYDAEEGVAVAPALAEVPDLDPELVRDLLERMNLRLAFMLFWTLELEGYSLN